MGLFGRRGSVDEAVLAELRAIRAEIHDLAEKVASAATRDDLEGYVPRSEFQAHLSSHRARVASHSARLATQRFWARYGVSIIAALISATSLWVALHR